MNKELESLGKVIYMPADKLTDKQKRFCEEYIIDLNATQAAIRAGYSKETARQIGTENLSKPVIQYYIYELQQERSKRTEITADMVLKELAHIAFDDIKNYLSFKTVLTPCGKDKETGEDIIDYRTVVELKDSDTIDTRNIAEISTGPNGVFKFKQYCKDNALVQLGKHLGMFRENVDMNLKGSLNNTNTNVNVDMPLDEWKQTEEYKRFRELDKKFNADNQ